jgi:methyl-accepting chemotaxis protein
MKLYQRILLAPGLAILSLGAFGAVASRALGTQRSAMEEIFKTRFGFYERATRTSSEVDAAHALAYRVVTWIGTYDEARLARISAELRERTERAATLAKELSAESGLVDRERELLEAVVADVARYGKSVAQAIDLASVDVNSGLAAMQTADLAFQQVRTNVDALVAVETQLAQDRYDEAGKAGRDATRLAWLVFLFAAASAAAAGLAVARAVSRQIGGEPEYAAEVASRVAEGDLTVAIHVAGGGASLLSAMRSMVVRLSEVVAEVRASAEGLASASTQVNGTAQALSQGTSEQAAAVEETSASLEEMSASLGESAESSRQTERAAAKGARDAAESGEAVSRTVEAMRAIAEKISFVDDLAYQTNLLALNAAIEAARAGTHGRGFAVVATEVRRLAETSQGAAKEISALAASSVGLAERTGRLLGDLVPSIQQTAELVQQVTAASVSQSDGVTQLNQSMNQVNHITQRNAAAAEELSSTAEELATQAASLERQVAWFRVADGRGGAPHAGRSAADPGRRGALGENAAQASAPSFSVPRSVIGGAARIAFRAAPPPRPTPR